jgi:hypothetical protein
MSHRLVTVAVALVALAVAPASASAGSLFAPFTPGAPGIGDPYFPTDGNGGYDADHYLLDLRYEPSTDVLQGVATMEAEATQNLSTFNLDFNGMNVRRITIDGRPATWTRNADELTITPPGAIKNGKDFTSVITYDGVPTPVGDAEIGMSGFIATDDGVLDAGQPEGADHWFPVNDHPLDKASYEFRVNVPAGTEAIANGELKSNVTAGGRTTWIWQAKEPMASYLTTVDIGQFDIKAYRSSGIRIWDALDPDLFASPSPTTGSRFAISQAANYSYKRLARTIAVPAGGGQLSFKVDRDTEAGWDFRFVEAPHVGQDDWTTLPDLNGLTTTTGVSGYRCDFYLQLHPFLAHYLTDPGGNVRCAPGGSSGAWNARSGASDGFETWAVDLGANAGSNVEVSISYASDDTIQRRGLVVDDIVGPGGAGSTSFENDGDTLDGWTVPGPPEGTPPNENDWTVGTAASVPSTGSIARAALDREPEILSFLEDIWGSYPFKASGGIVDDLEGLGFALETQTRPVYSKDFFDEFGDPADSVVVHELAHQWVGDDVALAAWQHIWLNEGFATYSEWLWSEDQGRATAQDYFDFYTSIPADDPFWSVKIGDPGSGQLFDDAVYYRGAATLHALRLKIGDNDFFHLLKAWISKKEGGNGTIPEFIALAQQISHQNLQAFFDEWLFTAAKPASLPALAAGRMSSTSSSRLAAARRLGVAATRVKAVPRP